MCSRKEEEREGKKKNFKDFFAFCWEDFFCVFVFNIISRAVDAETEAPKRPRASNESFTILMKRS